MSKIFICSYKEYPSSFVLIEYARKRDYNLEITTFLDPRFLDANLQETIKDYQQKLHGFKGAISMHGAAVDLVIHSRDAKVREVARQRIFQSLDIAKRLKAKRVVFHGNFDLLPRTESYKCQWLERNVVFWSEALEKYPSTEVLLENVHDLTPEMLRALLDKVNSPRLKICLDTGHMNVYSKVPVEEWIAVLGKDIASIHTHDNKGDADNHLAPGKGTIDWQKFSDLITEHQIDPDIVFEVFTLEAAIQSVKYFQEENIYPFRDKGGEESFAQITPGETW